MSKATVISSIVLIAAIVQPFIFYFYTYGMGFVFLAIPYSVLGLGFTIVAFQQVIKLNEEGKSWKMLFVMAVLSPIIAIGFFFIDMESIDWVWQLSKREQIIADIKSGKIPTTEKHNKVKLHTFPPLSNGGNEIMIYKYPDNTFDITFFVDRGFLDHWLEYRYTNNIEQQQLIEKRIAEGKPNLYRKLKDEWYRLYSYD
jgi:hypothetical protein